MIFRVYYQQVNFTVTTFVSFGIDKDLIIIVYFTFWEINRL